MARTRYSTPYADLLPPLSTTEREALKASIKTEGVRDAVVLDEKNNVLDGHHRLEIDPKAPTRVIKGLTEGEKQAYVFSSNFMRRNLSVEQRKELRAAMKKTAAVLREEDAKKNTQKRVATLLGVDQSTVARWFTPEGGGSNMQSHITSGPDARVAVPQKENTVIAERIEAGATQVQVAADYGVTDRTIRSIVAKETKQQEAAAERKKAAAAAKRTIKKSGDNGIYHGDAFQLAESIPDASCPLIFTDPPYDRDSLPMFNQLSELAGRILVDGGSLITYCGQYVMTEIIDMLLSDNRLRWFWVICCLHTGNTAQMREYGINVKWKPLLWFVKGKFRRDREIWVDDLVQSKQEKDAHPWQQSVVEASYYIGKLSLPEELVVDPFCGSGTTAVAAKQLGRQWWTADVEAKCVEDARKRINDTDV